MCMTAFTLTIMAAAIKKVKLIMENESDDNVVLGQPLRATLDALPEEMHKKAASILSTLAKLEEPPKILNDGSLEYADNVNGSAISALLFWALSPETAGEERPWDAVRFWHLMLASGV